MTRPADPPSPETLLAHREWMRAIARSLVGDENAVDDVEQRSWMTVLRNRRPVESVRGWLRSVVKSSVVDEHRSASRRRAREESAARPESLPPTDHLAAQAEAQRAVAAAVTGLPEPYRTTVLLRYFEELSLLEVATRMAVPLETVRTRLRRAHALLREALDDEFGGRRKWALVLLPLTKPRYLIPIGAATGGALVMAGKTKAVAVVMAVLLLTAGGWWAVDVATRTDTDPARTDVASVPAATVAAPRAKTALAAKPEVSDETALGGITVGVDVADAAGRAIANARVSMSRVAADPAVGTELGWGDDFLLLRGRMGSSAARTASTSESGAADVAGLVPGDWRLVVTAAGFAEHSELVPVTAAPPRRRVVLVPGCELSGLVLLQSGAAAAGAEVFAGECRAIADGTGRFRFGGLPSGVVALSAGMPRGALQQTESVTLPDVRDVTLRLAGGCALRGRVVDDDTGVGVGGARVVLRGCRYDDLPRSLRWGAETTSAADGTFALDDLPQGQAYALWAMRDGFAACRDGFTALGPYAAFTPGGTRTVELRMTHGGIVRGRVLRPDGSPVEGAVVDALSRRGRDIVEISGATLSAADGSFRLPVRIGRAMVRATAAGMEQRDLPKDWHTPVRTDAIPASLRVDVSAKDEATIDLVLVPKVATDDTGVLAGVVRREDGESPRGAVVRIGAALVCAAADDGSFVFEHLSPRRYWVTATADGCAEGKAPAVEVAATGVTKGVEVVLPRPLSISGRVVAPDGSAVPGASISVETQAGRYGDAPTVTVTANDGAFVVRGLSGGDWIVMARAPGFANAEVVAAAGTKDAVVRLEKTLAIAGVVTAAVDGTPVAGVRVSAMYSSNRSGFSLYRSATTDAAGRFELTSLAPDLYRLWFGSEGDAGDYVGRGVDGVHAGDMNVKVTLDRGTAIDGRVTDGAGHAVPGGLVAAFGPLEGTTPGLRVRLVRIEHDGTYVLPGLAPGLYDIEATPTDASGEQLTPARVARVQAGTHDVVIESRPSVVIEGRFLDDDGKPLPLMYGSAELRTLHPNGSLKSSAGVASQYNPDGSFRTQPLDPAETYDLVVTNVPGRIGGIARGLRPGARGVDIVIRKGGQISGRVLDASGAPVPAGLSVVARATTGRTWPATPGDDSFARTDADGRFVLTGIDDRPYRVEAGGDPSEFIEARTEKTYSPGATDVEIRLERGVAVSGRLVDAKGEALKAGFVEATRQGSPVSVDKEGRFTIRALKPGRYPLFAQIGQRIVDLGEVQAPSDSLQFTIKDE
jgi:RNA polymerase sigma-70 factor (ECF subfamily)